MNQALAAGMSGWTLLNPLAQGASTLYQGAKNVIINGKNVAKTSTALITPNATQVAKLLGKGVAGVALSFAVEQLLGKVDWVLDPENNRIKYKAVTVSGVFKVDGKTFTGSLNDACSLAVGGKKVLEIKFDSNTKSYDCYHQVTPSRLYGTVYVVDVASTEEKTIPLVTVAQKVIDNAQSNDQNAQVATTTAAADIVKDAEKDDVKAKPIVDQLEANAKTETDNTATGETKPNTETGGTDLALEFPTFCGWAPQVCEADQIVISFPQTLTDWWNTSNQKADSWAKSISDAYVSAKEWFQKEPEKNNDGTEVDVDTPTPFDNSVFSKDRFAVSRQCPIPEQHTISLSGVSVNFSFDMTPLCQVLILARPALVACSYLYAAYIVIGAARNG